LLAAGSALAAKDWGVEARRRNAKGVMAQWAESLVEWTTHLVIFSFQPYRSRNCQLLVVRSCHFYILFGLFRKFVNKVLINYAPAAAP
jgi:hypothetical protein